MSDGTDELDLKSYHDRIRDGVCDIVVSRLPEKPTPLHVDLILEKALVFAEKMTADLHRRYPIVEPTACSAGCSYCCYNHEVHVSPFEAIRIALYINNRMEVATREAVADRLATVMIDKKACDTDQPASDALPIYPCPLLDPGSGLCQAYDVRPLVCRGHNSISLPACKRRHASGIETGATIIGGATQRTVAQAVLAGLRKAFMANNQTDLVLDLTRALDGLLSDAGELQKALDEPEKFVKLRVRRT